MSSTIIKLKIRNDGGEIKSFEYQITGISVKIITLHYNCLMVVDFLNPAGS